MPGINICSTSLRSLHQFMERTNHPYNVRLHAGAFSIENATTPGGVPCVLMNLPYYLSVVYPCKDSRLGPDGQRSLTEVKDR